MCYPCRCPRRSVSCHGGNVCCPPRPCCRERSRSTCSPRVIFPGEFQKFSDMIPPSFLCKQPPKCEKAKKKSNCACKADKRIKKCSDRGDKGHEDNNEQARISGECVEMTGVPVNPCQPTDTPWCGPWENPMAISMPPQPQWVCFDCPATICFPRDPPGLQAAGLPTKRSPPFNPCTGQAYHQSEQRQQVMVGNYNETAQCPPTYNQFGSQGVNNPCYQFNPSHFGDGPISYEPQANLYEANRNQAYSQCCQAINMCPGPAYPYYPYDGEDGTCSPPPGDHRSLSPQGEKRSKGQRKGRETREGKVSKAPAESRKCPSPIAGQQHQGTRSESREAPRSNQHKRSNSRNPREESIGRRQYPQFIQSGRVAAQQNPSSGHVSQGARRSTSQGTRSECREAPRSNQQQRNSSRNSREESIGGRISLRTNSSGNQVPRSKSSEPAIVPHPCKSRSMSPERAPHGDGGRSKSLAKRNEGTREQRSKNMPESNLHFYSQNVDMSFGPSNQHFVAECPSPDPIYISQESGVGDSGSRRQQSKSPRGNASTRRNGESRKERQSPAGNQPELRFNPNNQYCQYSDECFCPPTPSPGDMRSSREKSHDRSQLLNRVRRSTNESRSLDDRQMSAYPSKTSKKQPADRTTKQPADRTTTGANKSTCKQCTQTKPCKPTRPTLADILANEVSSQPHVLMLSTQRDEKKEKRKIQKARAEPEPEQDQCVVEDEVNSCDDSLEDSSSCSDNEEEKPQKKTNEKAEKKTQEKAKKKPQKEAQEEAEELSNNDDAAKSSGCPPNSCWMGCPIPWSCCYGPYSGQWNGPCRSPCNGPFYYCGNCCTGCRQCCNYRCNPCGGYCCSQPPASQVVKSGKASTKPPSRKDTHKRSQGGAFESFLPFLQPPSTPSFPVSNYSTLPGYYPTAPPQFISPYNPMFSKQYP